MSDRSKKARQKEERRQAALARARRRRIIIWSSAVGAALIIVAIIALRPVPEELSGVESFPQMGRDHLAEGEAPPDYNSTPATSGDHSSSPADCGIYITEIPDQVQVHNLEHGAVVIQYQPDLDQSDIQALEAYARTKPSHILVAPRADLDDPVVVTSWTRMLRLPTADIATIDLYYDQFAFSGPEVGVPCPFAVDQSA
ncbi:MAG: DUF3105 domain-containing protein [Acidimicrobiia bacterium]